MAENIKLDKAKAELLITVNAKTTEWKDEQQKAFKALASNLTLKGFRKGQAPLELARKEIRAEDIFTGALKKILDILVREASAQIDEKTLVLDSPTYRVDKISDTDLQVTFIYPVYPEITLGNYRDLVAPYAVKAVTDEDVANELNKVLTSRSATIDKDGLLAKGDIAIFDFEGFVNGEPFEGGKAEKYELELGSNQFIAGFEDQMVSMKVGEERHVAVKFPADYQFEKLRGQDAIFIVKLRNIKAKVAPVLDEAFISSLNINNVKTVDDMRAYIRKVFAQQAEQDARIAFQREAFSQLRASSKFVVPESLIDREAHRQEEQFEQDLKRQGLDVKRYEKMAGFSHNQLHEQFHASAETRLRDSIIFAEISKVEKLEVTEADYEAAYLKYAEINNQSLDSVKSLITKAQLQIPLTNDKVIDFLIAHREVPKAKEATKAIKAKEATKVVKAKEAAKAIKVAPDDSGEAKEVTKTIKAKEATKAIKASEATKTIKPQEVTRSIKASDQTKTAEAKVKTDKAD